MINLYRLSYSKNVPLLDQLFFGVRGSKSFVDTLLLRLNPSDQKHSTRNCIKFADTIFLVLNVDSRGEKKVRDRSDTESRNSTHIKLFEVEFREITL